VLPRDADANESKLPRLSTPPLGQQVVPTQDAGFAPARPLPYQAMANLAVVGGDVRIDLSNAGTAGLQLAVYAHHLLGQDVTPHDVAPGGSASATVGLDFLTNAYDIDVHGPNGAVRVAGGAVLSLPAHGSIATTIATDHGWYDVTLSLDGHDDWARRFAGHVENGQPSRTG